MVEIAPPADDSDEESENGEANKFVQTPQSFRVERGRSEALSSTVGSENVRRGKRSWQASDIKRALEAEYPSAAIKRRKTNSFVSPEPPSRQGEGASFSVDRENTVLEDESNEVNRDLSPVVEVKFEPAPKIRVKLKRKSRKKTIFQAPAFRATFGTNGMIVSTLKTKKGQFALKFNQISDGKIDRTETLQTKCIEQCMLTHRKYHSNTKEKKHVMLCDLCNQYVNTYQKLKSKPGLSEDAKQQFQQIIFAWKLIKVLWGEEFVRDSKYGENLARKNALNDWVVEMLLPDLQKTLTHLPNGPEKIFYQLASGQRRDAVETCWLIGDVRLATLLVNFETQNLEPQIEKWKVLGHWETFTDHHKRIYQLLTGRFTKEVVEGLNWLQCLCLIINFCVPRNGAIEEVLHFYTSSVQNSKLQLPSPHFSYHGESASILFVLLELYSRTRANFDCNPFYIQRSPLDFHDIWHIHDALLIHRKIELSTKTHIFYREFIAQLERRKSWDWAVYVTQWTEVYGHSLHFERELYVQKLMCTYWPCTSDLAEEPKKVEAVNRTYFLQKLEDELEETPNGLVCRSKQQICLGSHILKYRDVIFSVNGQRVPTKETYRKALTTSSINSNLVIQPTPLITEYHSVSTSVDMNRLKQLGILLSPVAKGWIFTRLRKWEEAAHSFCLGQKWGEAARICCEELLPKLILIDKAFKKSQALLSKFEDHKEKIDDWKNKGEIYSLFLNSVSPELFLKDVEIPTDFLDEEKIATFNFLSKQLEKMFAENVWEKTLQIKMSDHIKTFLEFSPPENFAVET